MSLMRDDQRQFHRLGDPTLDLCQGKQLADEMFFQVDSDQFLVQVFRVPLAQLRHSIDSGFFS